MNKKFIVVFILILLAFAGFTTYYFLDKAVPLNPDAVGNSAFVDMQFENAKYINQTYEYRDTISLRNSYAITVAPNKMFLDTTP